MLLNFMDLKYLTIIVEIILGAVGLGIFRLSTYCSLRSVQDISASLFIYFLSTFGDALKTLDDIRFPLGQVANYTSLRRLRAAYAPLGAVDMTTGAVRGVGEFHAASLSAEQLAAC